MKNHNKMHLLKFIILISIIISPVCLKGQSALFSHDAGGNRTSREIEFGGELKSLLINESLNLGESKDESDKTGIRLYPNPTDGHLIIELPEDFVSGFIIYIQSISGQVMLNEHHNKLKVIVDLKKFSSGIYFLQISNETHTELRKIIKQ